MYRNKVWETSLEIQKSKTDIRNDGMSIFIGAIIILVVLIFPFAQIITKGEIIPVWLWGVFGGDVVVLIGSLFSHYVLAFFDMWKIVEKEHKEQEEKINDLEDKLSNKKIKIINLEQKIILANVDTELRPHVLNDSRFLMEKYFALVEDIKYAKAVGDKPEPIKFVNNSFHLVWPGDCAIADRSDPIAPGDSTQLAIAATLKGHNGFKFRIRESDRFNIFINAGYYFLTARIGGTFDGIGIIKRIEFTIAYDGGKTLDITRCLELQEEI